MTELIVSRLASGGRGAGPAGGAGLLRPAGPAGIPYRWIDFSGRRRPRRNLPGLDTPLGVPGMKNLLFSDRKGSILLYVLLPREKRSTPRPLPGAGPAAAQHGQPGCPAGAAATPQAGLVSLSELQYDTGHRIRVFLDRELLDLGQISMLPNVDLTMVGLSAGDVVDKLLPATGHGYEVLEPEDPAWAPMEERKESLT